MSLSSCIMSTKVAFYVQGRILKPTTSPSACRPRGPGSVSRRFSSRRCSNSNVVHHKARHVLATYTTQDLKEAEADETSGRRSADYHPSVWGDYFLKYASADPVMVDDEAVERIHELKSEVKRMLGSDDYKSPSEKLNLIDQIQSFGIVYHFNSEIKESLEQIHLMYLNSEFTEDDDLHTTALRFRLLRQFGYKISSGVFDKFKDSDGNFRSSLIFDERGLLSLYEASHYRFHCEENLEEALCFCINHLKSMEDKSSRVSHALKQPKHRTMPRLEARRHIETYEIEDSRDEVILNLAKLDFNWTQKQHQREVAEITRWWKDFEFTRKLPFVRDRVVESYFWILGVYFEPEYEVARKILTKVLAMISAIDDVYDVYGTFEELELFSEAVERWDIDARDELPGYMQFSYSALLDLYDEIEEILAEQGRLYFLYYPKEAMKIIVRGYMEEAKWLQQQHVPTIDEYMEVARITAGYQTLTITSLVGMPEITSKDTFEWLLSEPKIVKSSATACRLMDDIASHKFEQERGHIASSVECYMRQYRVSEEEAEDELGKRVENAWKDINEERVRLTEVPDHVLMRIVNFVRMLDIVYKDGDCYTNSETKLKDIISSLLIHPVPI